ncbi:hypothetical protein K488DRAFT_83224 [Vararia minispora EC-137]|uniref:Uncharacterized protein n=1 Tax=Vararia minispora EC-137 TaxID=1314806 RepID=A0ACB8QUB9_9AGAM|nr:hypothetical protein K488DRAFT_83224 [Vararia minispora EC-137]
MPVPEAKIVKPTVVRLGQVNICDLPIEAIWLILSAYTFWCGAQGDPSKLIQGVTTDEGEASADAGNGQAYHVSSFFIQDLWNFSRLLYLSLIRSHITGPITFGWFPWQLFWPVTGSHCGRLLLGGNALRADQGLEAFSCDMRLGERDDFRDVLCLRRVRSADLGNGAYCLDALTAKAYFSFGRPKSISFPVRSSAPLLDVRMAKPSSFPCYIATDSTSALPESYSKAVTDIPSSTFVFHRAVLCRPWLALKHLQAARQLVAFVRDALTAHRHALRDAGVLHRDVSLANICIDDDQGILIDWDLRRGAGLDAAVDPRVGSSCSLSVQWMRKPKSRRRLSDDIESFVYVLLDAVRYIPSELYALRRSALLDNFFFFSYSEPDAMKRRFLTREAIPPGHAILQYLDLDTPWLYSLLGSLLRTVALRYMSFIDARERDRQLSLEDYEKTEKLTGDYDWILDLLEEAVTNSSKDGLSVGGDDRTGKG